ncbi:hypothetical protein ABT063_02055 [Streptomyces sp. NPDC002838]|uniref:hypothetical protein n=1 Tax=Streptomyces sp. NPDC002838 TaxID=3154436 RepID=UPI0033300668
MKRCTESFTIWRDGAPVAFVAGQLVDDKHPILKTHKHLFEEPTATVVQAAQLKPVEQATAEPGTPRSLTPPTQTADSGGGGPKPFDPGEHTAPEVIEYLKGADEDERVRVLAAEENGQARKTVLSADLTKA